MGKTGIANLPLHNGKVPSWLFDKMVILSREIIYLICIEFGREELLKRLSDPFWFQAFGCTLGFDWHSSGLTTTTCGAIKMALRNIGNEIGLFAAGGKGKTALKTPQEIDYHANKLSTNLDSLKHASRIVARVDNAALQDGYNIYHHSIFFTDNGNWCIIQQGFNEVNSMARRYHWLKETTRSFTCEPHKAICSNKKETFVLNLVSKQSQKVQRNFLDFLNNAHPTIERELKTIEKLNMPKHHYISAADINSKRFKKTLLNLSEQKIRNFEALLSTKGVGPKTIRALSLISEIVYGDKPSFKDPARFSFAHGGKDGHPYPVNLTIYQESIELLRKTINAAKIGYTEKLKAFKRLSKLNLIENA